MSTARGTSPSAARQPTCSYCCGTATTLTDSTCTATQASSNSGRGPSASEPVDYAAAPSAGLRLPVRSDPHAGHRVPGRPKAHAQHPGHGVRDDAGEPTAEAIRWADQGDDPVLDLDRPAAVGLRLLQQQRLQIGPDVLVPTCLLYTSDAADDLLCVDLGGRRI